MNYNICTLPDGMRVIHLPSGSPVVYCGIAVAAGTRHELPGEEGLAHFCEHLSFKGTRRRSAVQIINALEGVGGELNAFTNKEDTVFYCAILRDHIRRAVDVLTDIVFCSEYPQQEVEKEREVVCDEIESYEDSPSELIFDDIENLLFEGHPLGHNILGTSERVRSYDSSDAHRFTARHYRPQDCVFFASGDVDFRKLVKWLSPTPDPSSEGRGEGTSTIDNIREESIYAPPSQGGVGGGSIVRERGTHQAHVIIAAPAFAANDPRRWSLYLLNNILGGPSLNSRLSLSLRERRGLVYTVESSMVAYSDTGIWTTYFGCDPADISRCRRLVRHELDRLMEHPFTDSQLNAAKRQLQGQLAISCDSREQFALDFARNYLHTGVLRDLTDIMRHIESLTPADLQLTAQQLFAPERTTTLIYR
ncbi:MAG: insulinase family protein [Prevotella sp.]|nr:insulinase family protein [Prevotella sp.]